MTGIGEQLLRRTIGATGGAMLPEAPKFFLQLELGEADRQRIEALSEKANEGELSDEERDELSTYVFLADFLLIMQWRAREVIKSHSPAA